MRLRNGLIVAALTAGLASTPAGLRAQDHSGQDGHGDASEQAEDATVSVAGKWEMTMDSPMGEISWTVQVEQNGDMVSGYAESAMGTFPVEGFVVGTEWTFDVAVDAHGTPMVLGFVGDVEGDEAWGVANMQGEPYAWTAKRIGG